MYGKELDFYNIIKHIILYKFDWIVVTHYPVYNAFLILFETHLPDIFMVYLQIEYILTQYNNVGHFKVCDPLTRHIYNIFTNWIVYLKHINTRYVCNPEQTATKQIMINEITSGLGQQYLKDMI